MRLLLLGRQAWPAVQGVVRAASAPWAARLSAGAARTGVCARVTAVVVPVRGKKTRTVVRVDDLPQGVLGRAGTAPEGAGRADAVPAATPAASPATPADTPADAPADTPAYPTVVLQARRNMQRFTNCVLLTRVGGFYELYFEHAQELGPLLNLKVAAKRTSAGPVPMAGFPFFQLDRFLKILVHELNRHVAIAEEFPNAAADKLKAGGLLHDRRVARIVTPGTLIDETFMDPYTNNYVLAIHVAERPSAEPGENAPGAAAASAASAVSMTSTVSATMPVGLAWLDLSTGHFYTQATTLAALSSALARVAPREIVLDERLQEGRGTTCGAGGASAATTTTVTPPSHLHPLLAVLEEDRQLQPQQQQQLITYAPAPEESDRGDTAAALAAWAPVLESPLPPETARALTADEVAAGSLLLHYVRDRLQGSASLMKLQPPVRYGGHPGSSDNPDTAMVLDKNTLRALEVKQTLRDGAFRGSLLHAIRRTVTRSGARLLNEWLSAPSTSLPVLTARQDRVARFVADPDLRDAVTQLLRRSHDAHRLVQKFALGRGDPDDLLDLAKTIDATDAIVGLLQNASPSDNDCLAALAARIELDRPRAVAARIRASVDEEGLQHQHEQEEHEAEALLALAHDAVEAEAKTTTKPVAATAAAPRRRAPSFRDYYGEDNEAWVMKPSASDALTALHAQLAERVRERSALTETLRARLQAPSLVLKWTPGLGHICHVRGKDARVGDSGRRKAGKVGKDDKAGNDNTVATPTTLSSSRTTRSLHVPEWTALGQRLDQVRFHIRAEEQRVFQDLRAAVVRSLVPLRRNAAVLDELDIATAFARLASEHGWCRPHLHAGTTTAIVGGRHPTVEGGLAAQGRSFTDNDLYLGVAPGATEAGTTGAGAGAETPRTWLITGPNMAGKSTFLRQSALITLLAQIGSYVPAAAASLGLADALFSRVGSADNLFRDQSTFMVEMLETAHILRAATPRSVVIMDEIGRGTTPEDGAAVAYAALHHLVHTNRCRTLFATHFHALADRINGGGGRDPVVGLYCTDVAEDAHGFAYVHRLRPGVNRRSHALKVARLAGLPEAAIRQAEAVLAETGAAA